MSDIKIKCRHCGQEMTVSEFVDAASLTCKCGRPMDVPSSSGPKRVPTVVRMRQQAEIEEALKKPKVRVDLGAKKSRLLKLGRLRITDYALSWILFFVLGAGLSWLRYGSILSQEGLEDCKTCGLIGCALLYAVIIIEALREEVFDGLLSFFVPPYAVYYLFAKSDSFILRALVAAFAAAFGVDAYGVLSVWIKNWVDAMHAFIERGG